MDNITLAGGKSLPIIKCEKCEHQMVNIDATDVFPGDLSSLKKAGLRVSNAETKDPICLNCEVDTWGSRVAKWFEDDNDDDDDSGFFPGSGGSSFGTFGSGTSHGSGGSFGGFGGGIFNGGGASSSW